MISLYPYHDEISLDLPQSVSLLKDNDNKLFPVLKMGWYNNLGEKVPAGRMSSVLLVALCCSLITPQPIIVIGVKCYDCMYWVGTKLKLGTSPVYFCYISVARPGQFAEKKQKLTKNSKTLVERKIIIHIHWTTGAFLDKCL